MEQPDRLRELFRKQKVFPATGKDTGNVTNADSKHV